MLGLLLADLVIVGVEAALAQDDRHRLAAPVDLKNQRHSSAPTPERERHPGAALAARQAAENSL